MDSSTTLRIQEQLQSRTRDPDLSAQNADDATLVERMTGGDATALRQFYERHSPTVYGLCLRVLGGNAHDAEEVLLDVFHEFWRRASSYDASRGSPLGLLVTLARSRAIDLRRSRAGGLRAVTFEDIDTAAAAASTAVAVESRSPAATLAQRQECEQVRHAIRSLEPQQRQAIEGVYYDGLSHSELARALNKPLGTVKTHVRQGLLRLREALRELDPAGAGAGTGGDNAA
jgi:RNA polymerase sigma-70 factor (ECF subfamily)